MPDAIAQLFRFSQQLELDRGQVRLWRNRWLEASAELTLAEMEAVSDEKLMNLIEQVLSDQAREGTPNFFSTEQVVQIQMQDGFLLLTNSIYINPNLWCVW